MERAILFSDYSFSEVFKIIIDMFTNRHISLKVSVAITSIIIFIGGVVCGVNLLNAKKRTSVNSKRETRSYSIANTIAIPCFIYAYIINLIMFCNGCSTVIPYLMDINPILTLSIITYFIIASKNSTLKDLIIEGIKHFFICFAKFIEGIMIFVIIVLFVCIFK